MKRKYYGRVYALKSYRGAKSINIKFAPETGFDLVVAIVKATKDGLPIDLAIHDYGNKEGPILVTVTSKP